MGACLGPFLGSPWSRTSSNGSAFAQAVDTAFATHAHCVEVSVKQTEESVTQVWTDAGVPLRIRNRRLLPGTHHKDAVRFSWRGRSPVTKGRHENVVWALRIRYGTSHPKGVMVLATPTDRGLTNPGTGLAQATGRKRQRFYTVLYYLRTLSFEFGQANLETNFRFG